MRFSRTCSAAGLSVWVVADKVLAQYPWPKDADKYTGAYLAGAVVTDSGHIAGIGGCASLKLTQDFAKYAPVYAYEFGHRTGPGLTREHGAYEWEAGHAAELAYLFPSFNNGEPITPLFNAGERALAESMKGYWGAFVKQGVPGDKTGATWPIFNAAGQVMSLHPNDQSFATTPASARIWSDTAIQGLPCCRKSRNLANAGPGSSVSHGAFRRATSAPHTVGRQRIRQRPRDTRGGTISQSAFVVTNSLSADVDRSWSPHDADRPVLVDRIRRSDPVQQGVPPWNPFRSPGLFRLNCTTSSSILRFESYQAAWSSL